MSIHFINIIEHFMAVNLTVETFHKKTPQKKCNLIVILENVFIYFLNIKGFVKPFRHMDFISAFELSITAAVSEDHTA